MENNNTIKQSIFQKPKIVLLLAMLTTFLWGSAFPCVKMGYQLFAILEGDKFSKILFAGYRFALAGILVLAFAFLLSRKLSLPDQSHMRSILLLSFIQTTLQYALFYIGLAYTTGVKGSILYSANTFVAVLLAHFIYQNEKLDWKKGLGCLSGFAGVIVINSNGNQLGGGFSVMGEGMIILAAVSFGVGALISKKTAQYEDVMAVTGYQLLLGGILLILFALSGKGHLTTFSFSGIAVLFYLALLSAVSFTLWTILLKYNEVGNITVYNFLIPIFGVTLSAVILGERVFENKTLVALILVCAGIFVINKPRHPEKI